MYDLFLECAIHHLNLARKFLATDDTQIGTRVAIQQVYIAAQNLLYHVLNDRALITNQRNSCQALMQLIDSLDSKPPYFDAFRPYAQMLDNMAVFDRTMQIKATTVKEITEGLNYALVEVMTEATKYDPKQQLRVYC